ncbi:MAG: riboflavin synthase [Gemmatimonadota bacterium]|nr:riboflavin synthase [Gemmatimonadota bacterium]MXX14933.1 riboflavin synthase [Gemmatimonadota bacterium]MYB56710.1 riboflavin synthase [Gemmatimonadota bacterium]MYD64252.1 riboflavin synthase [Gemmatimonadota bacterium]
MFTGIVEEVGTIRHIESRADYQRTTIAAKQVLNGVKIGDSIAIEGACHTVVHFDADTFVIESIAETLQRTTLGDCRVGNRVNLERSLKLGDRLDGHLVAAHIDGVGHVKGRTESSDQIVFEFEVPPELAPYIAEKGSITVNGISLTVIAVTDRTFSIAAIPHTLKVTTLSEKYPGDRVNIEVDIIARYLERLVQPMNGKNMLTEDRIRAMMSDR